MAVAPEDFSFVTKSFFSRKRPWNAGDEIARLGDQPLTVKSPMRKVLSIPLLALTALLVPATPSDAEDGIAPYANLNLWTAWSYRTAELGEGLILLDEVGKSIHDKLTYQSDVTASASSFIGITGEKNDVAMKAEIGVYPSTPKTPPALTIRYLYAASHFGPFELRAGYDMSPYEAVNRNDVCDGEIFADAAMFDSFQPQIRLSVAGAYVQIMRSVVNNSELYLDSGLVGIGVSTTTGNTRSFLPKTALGYVYTASHFRIGAHGLFQTYSIDDHKSPLDGVGITSAVGSVDLQGELGPFSFLISGFMGQNPGELGIFTHNNKNGNYSAFNAAANNKAKTDTSFRLRNTIGSGFSASAGYKMGLAQFNAGIAYDRDQNEVFRSKLFPTDIDDSYAFFANCSFSLRPNLKVTPTVKVVNYLETPGNAFQAFDDGSKPIIPNTKEGVNTRFGFAFQASI
jgi:hypothetical protein